MSATVIQFSSRRRAPASINRACAAAFPLLSPASPACGTEQEKPDDRWAIPLCGGHHREQHKGNEVAFWIKQGIDPIFVALALHSVTGDFEKGEMIIATAKEALNAFQRPDAVAHV